MKRKVIATALAALVAGPVAAAAESNLLFVLDASGSMWGKVEGTHKISTAKTVLDGLIGDLPAGTRAGLMVYGHRQKSWCEDVELVAPVGTISARTAAAALDGITPRGKTPIGYALRQTRAAFSGLPEGEAKHVVLISDGIETCDGDPCAAAGALAASGINVKVHVVGFDVSEADRRQLQCIAEMGKGRYFSADSTADFADAVSQAVQVAASPAATAEPAATPAPEPGPATLFVDDFDGTGLAPHWEVRNEDADSYLVEDGGLISVAYGGPTLEAGNAVNIFRLDRDLPKGDWVATMQYRMPYHTGREAPFFGIYEDKENHLVATANAWSYYDNNTGARLYLSAHKLAKGEKTSFNSVIWGGPSGERFALGAAPNPFVLRITKKGRSYVPAVRYNNGGEDVWVEGEQMTALRLKGRLAFGIYQAENVAGETPIHVDWVRIEALQ